MKSNQRVGDSQWRRALTVAAAYALCAVGTVLLSPPTEAAAYRYTTVAGQPGAWGWEDGPAAASAFYNPNAMAVDAGGNIYVADSLNHLLRVITPNGEVRRLAGRLLPNDGWGHHEVEPGDGQGAAAHFHYPAGLAINPEGNVVVADSWHHTLRVVTPDGQVTTLAGQPNLYGHLDGPGWLARLDLPSGLAMDADGNVFVADLGSHTIRKVTPDGDVSTVAGRAYERGTADGPASSARFCFPTGLAFDAVGNLFIADQGNSIIRKLTPEGLVLTVAGRAGESGHEDGPGLAARLHSPCGLVVDAQGNLLVADARTHVIRRMNPAGLVSTVGGMRGWGNFSDGIGGGAWFYAPFGLALDRDGTLLVADAGNHVIRRGKPLPQPELCLQMEGGIVQLVINGTPGALVVVEYRDTLEGDNEWLPLEYCWLWDGTGTVLDPDSDHVPQRFYRLRAD